MKTTDTIAVSNTIEEINKEDTVNLNDVLKKHKKWLNHEEGGERADFSGADLRYINLEEENLSYAIFNGANLSRANLSWTKLYSAEFEGANLNGANFEHADLTHAYFSHANLEGARFERATLRSATLKDTNLKDAYFKHAVLSSADMRFADLAGADLDFSCLPLWCGSLSAKFDDKQIIQIIYHAVKAGLSSPNVSDELKQELRKMIHVANRFHRTKECGKIQEEAAQ